MIKDILVALPTGYAPSFALVYAVTIARTFDAHLTGVAFLHDLAARERCLMVRRQLFWMIVVGKQKPLLKLQKPSSKKGGSEKASPPN